MSKKNMNNDGIFVLALKLFIICLCVAFGLSLLNYITKDTIANQNKMAKDAAMAKIMGDCNFEPQNEEETVYIALGNDGNVGYVVNVISPKGYGGPIEMMVGFDDEFRVVGIDYITMSETPGLGMKVKTDGKFNSQFKGKEAFEDSELDVITGATVSSKAVNFGVNEAEKILKDVLKNQTTNSK